MLDIASNIGAEHALQEGVFSVLSSDRILVDLLGGQKFFDRVPERTAFPYVAFSNLSSRDASTASESAVECRLTLTIWSQEPGRRLVLALKHRIRSLLHDQGVSLRVHKLINLREEFSDIAQTSDRQSFRALIRFRAFIELEPGGAE